MTDYGDGLFAVHALRDTARVIVIPVPWEATTSYGRGTARGPAAVAAASVQVDLFDVEVGTPTAGGIAMLPVDDGLQARSDEASAHALEVIAAFQAGRPLPQAALDRVNALSRWQEQHVQALAARWIAAGRLVATLGGDHSVAYGPIAAHAEAYPGMGILHFDAHADLRVAYEGFDGSHASIMHRVTSEIAGVSALVSVGLRDLCAEEHAAIVDSGGRIRAFFDADIARALAAGKPFGDIARAVADSLPGEVYVSFDVDGLDPTLCPHTGTPVPGGLSWHQAMSVLAAVVDSGRRIVGLDLVEVAPGDDEWDANVGARLLHKLIGFALKSRAT